jgi:hypothetical protein
MDDPVRMTSGVKAAYEAKLKSHEIETLGIPIARRRYLCQS